LRAKFLMPAPMHERNTVWLSLSVRMLNTTPRKSRINRSVRTVWGVRGPSRTCSSSSSSSSSRKWK
jgi:hypothetical protein